MWKLDLKKEEWIPVKYTGYYPKPRRGGKFVKASESELILIGGRNLKSILSRVSVSIPME